MESSWDFRDILYGSDSSLHCATVWIRRVSSLPPREGGNTDNELTTPPGASHDRPLFCSGWALHGRAVQQDWPGPDHLVSDKSWSLFLKTRGSVFSIHKTSRQGERRGNILFKAGNNIFTLSAERKIQQGWHRHAQPQWWPRSKWSNTASKTAWGGELFCSSVLGQYFISWNQVSRINWFELWVKFTEYWQLRQPGAEIANFAYFALMSGCWEAGRVSRSAGGGLGHQERHQSVCRPLRQHCGPHGHAPKQSPGESLVLNTFWISDLLLIPAPSEVDQCHHGRYRQGPVQQAQPARDGVHASAKMGGHRGNATSVTRSHSLPNQTFVFSCTIIV